MDELLNAGGALDPLAEIYLELHEFSERAESAPFQAAVRALTELTGVPDQPIAGLESVRMWALPVDSGADQRRTATEFADHRLATLERFQAKVDELTAQARPSEVRESYLVLDLGDARGCSDDWFIGLFPTRDALAAVAAIGTFGNEQELSNADLLDFLLKLRRTEEFVVSEVRRDALTLRFATEVREPEQLAARFYDICSDVIHQGYGTMRRLIAAIRDERVVRLWWD